jgi:PKHD-type hydroxylase
VVQDTFGQHSVKLPAGDLILYSSSSLHRVNPVTRGARVSSFFWTQSMVADERQRELLFQMDQSIQRIRGKHGESEETVQLAGQYHNLLRMWSDV